MSDRAKLVFHYYFHTLSIGVLGVRTNSQKRYDMLTANCTVILLFIFLWDLGRGRRTRDLLQKIPYFMNTSDWCPCFRPLVPVCGLQFVMVLFCWGMNSDFLWLWLWRTQTTMSLWTLLRWIPDANRVTWKLDSLDFEVCWLKFGAVTNNKWQTTSKDFHWTTKMLFQQLI